MHRRTLALALIAFCVPAFVAAALARADGATIDKTGWWNRANTASSTPAGQVTVPPPPGIPEGDIVVSAVSGEASAVAAVGIQPEAGPGATVRSFTMTVREDPDADGNQATEDAVIVACPIVAFWAGGGNGTWDTRAEADCDAASAEGVRNEDGKWTFDLRAIGELWYDPFSTVLPDGVLLVVGPEAEGSFQAVFLGAEGIEVDFDAEESEVDDPFSVTTQPDPPADAGLNSGPSGGGSSVFSPPRITTPPTTRPPTTTTPVPPVADGSDDPDTDVAAPLPDVASPRRDRSGELLGNFPAVTFLGIPAVLAMLLAASYWLGPIGDPANNGSNESVRRGGVSRVLEARARAARGN